MHYWEKLRFEIPYVAMDIATHRERYRCLRESVMLVVRDYNSNLTSLSPQARGACLLTSTLAVGSGPRPIHSRQDGTRATR